MEITLNNKYIITRMYTNTTDKTTTNKEQVVTITYKEEDADGKYIYKFDYGNVGYHEGYSKLDNIRSRNLIFPTFNKGLGSYFVILPNLDPLPPTSIAASII